MEIMKMCDIADWGECYSAWDNFAQEAHAPQHIQEIFQECFNNPMNDWDSSEWNNNWYILWEYSGAPIRGCTAKCLRILYKNDKAILISKKGCNDMVCNEPTHIWGKEWQKDQ